jgi:hypothetical protein
MAASHVSVRVTNALDERIMRYLDKRKWLGLQ